MHLRTATLLTMLSIAASTLTATPVSFYGFLNGPSESPVNPSTGTGFAFVTIDSVANTMKVHVDFTGLTSGVTASHIHVINGPGDANTADTLGPVATTTPTFTGFPSGVTAGTFDGTFDMTLASSYRAGFITDAGGTTALAEAALFAGITEGRAYLNIHTTTSSGGEIRSFLAPVPEPATAGLVIGALLGCAVFRRKGSPAIVNQMR